MGAIRGVSDYANNFINGIKIFKKYMPDVTLSASHGVIHLGPPPELVDARDKKTLENLGFHEEEDYECWGWIT